MCIWNAVCILKELLTEKIFWQESLFLGGGGGTYTSNGIWIYIKYTKWFVHDKKIDNQLVKNYLILNVYLWNSTLLLFLSFVLLKHVFSVSLINSLINSRIITLLD